MARVESEDGSSSSESSQEHHEQESQEPSDEESDAEEKARALDEAIDANEPSSERYEEHVRLLRLLHQLDDVPRLRNAYRRLYDACPMAPTQWLRRLRLEVRVAEDRTRLHQLFQSAFVDCYSVHIYTEWSTVSLSNAEGEVDPRKVCETALQCAGSDPIDGALLWDTTREFELAHLSMMDTASKDYSSQAMKIFHLFERQLSRPLLQSEKTSEDFKTFMDIMSGYITDGDTLVKRVEAAHAVAEDVLKQLLVYENELENTKDDKAKDISEKCTTYIKYIAHVKSLIDDKRYKDCDVASLLRVLYDRITSECFAPSCRGESYLPEEAEEICKDYVEHSREYSSDEMCYGAMEKVTRRCPRKSSLWILKLQHAERIGKDFVEIKNEFEKSLSNGFDTPEEYVALWLCYLEILRRRTDFESQEQIEILRKTFRLAWDSLSELWGDEADGDFVILQYWARLEYQHTKDYAYGEELFKEILEYGDNKLRGSLWLEYVAMERLRGGPSTARDCLRRAVRSSPDPRLQHAWLSLERDHGTLDTMMECVKVSADKKHEWEQQKLKMDNNRFNKPHFNDNRQSNKKQAHHQPKNDSSKANKRPHPSTDHDHTLNKKTAKHEDRFKNSKSSDLKRKNKDFSGHESSPKKSRFGGEGDSRRVDLRTHTEKVTFDEEKGRRVAFISNLDFEVDESALKAKLTEFGDIDELRLVSGVRKFGSICYCVYKDQKSVDVAISNDRTLFADRPMFISRYRGTNDAKTKHFTYSTGIERNKLFVRNIPFDHCIEEKLREIFQKYGDLKDVRIVTFKTGKPKGTAYVDYACSKSASSAVTALDGTQVGGRILSVAISAPPPRKADTIESVPSTSFERHSKTMLFVPTVLQKSTKADNNTVTAPSTSNKLSNSDFRSMLLGQK